MKAREGVEQIDQFHRNEVTSVVVDGGFLRQR